MLYCQPYFKYPNVVSLSYFVACVTMLFVSDGGCLPIAIGLWDLIRHGG